MGRIISIGYKGDLVSSDLNYSFHGLIGENIVVDGFTPVPGSAYNKLSLAIDGANPSRLRIRGAEILETETLQNIITLPVTGSGATPLTYEVVCSYNHSLGSVQYLARPSTGVFNVNTECHIGNVTFPKNYTASNQLVIKKNMEMAKLSDLKTLPFGSPFEKFQIDFGKGPMLKYIEAAGSGADMHLRNSVDSAYGNLTVNNLTVLGSSYTASQQTLDTTGEWILINTDLPGTSEPYQNAGVKINRGVQTDASLMWDELNNQWKAGLENYEQEIMLANNSKFSNLNADGTIPWDSITGAPEFSLKSNGHNKNEDWILKKGGVTIEVGDNSNVVFIRINGGIKESFYENQANPGRYIYSGNVLAENVINLLAHIKNGMVQDDTVTVGTNPGNINILKFVSNGVVKAYISTTGKYMGDADTVDGFHHDQSLLTTASPTFKKVSAEFDSNNKSILSSTAVGGQILVKAATAKQLDFGFYAANESTPTLVASLKSDGKFSTKGDITSEGKIFNAVYNDYAEFFEMNPGSKILPGDVVGKIKGVNYYDVYDPMTCSMPVGIYSDNFGHIIGGNPGEIEDNLADFIPVALKGRVHVKADPFVEEGQFMVPSSMPGIAMGTWTDVGRNVLGIALESSEASERPGYILTLVR